MSRHGTASGGRGRPVTVESVGKVAVVAGLLVAVLDVVLDLLTSVVQDAPVDVVDMVLDHLIFSLSYMGLLGAIVALVALGATSRAIGWGVLAVYVTELLDGWLDQLVSVVLNGGIFEIDLVEFLNPLFTVTTFLGIAIAYRLFDGQTAFPGVNVRI